MNNQNKVTFADGVFAKEPKVDFVKAKISIKKDEFFNWCKTHEGNWVNLDVKVSKGGKWYVQVNDWKPEANDDNTSPEDVPFPDSEDVVLF